MDAFAGYKIEKRLKTFGKRSTNLARNLATNQEVLLRVVEEKKANALANQLLQQEFELMKTLKGEGILAGLDLVVGNEGTAIVMKPTRGQLLSTTFSGQALDLKDFFTVAIQLTNIIGELHRQGIEHRNITLENFLYEPEEKKVLLFDYPFAVKIGASRLPNEVPLNDARFLSYISPEQTGRTNRKVDHRTDIYSLGIVFYQLLTGHLPFESEDLAALAHAHLAKQAPAFAEHNPDIPPILSALVHKMMHKAPEQRYQTAIGLKHDLEHCRRLFLQTGKIEDFDLGSKDISDLFEIPQKLYGRKAEIAALDEAWKKASTGEAELMMVAGFSGIGKSALIQQLESAVVSSNGFFVQGKYDQFQRDTPYSAGIEAFSQLVRQILSKTDEDIAYWKTRFNEALGPNLGVILEVLPELELITGQAPDVVTLPPSESQSRFNLAFLQFFQSIPNKNHPLVLFLDDLQWVDIPSLKLMELAMTDKETNSLLLLGAYRDNEVDETHPLVNTLESLEKQKVPFQEINLGQLNFKDLNQLIADTLKTELSNTKALTELVLRKTGGNPFFTIAFLKSLNQDKLIQFNYGTEKWEWDIDRIEQENITENVVDLMTKKIKLLDEKTQWLLQLASCIGNKFDLTTLSIVYEQSRLSTSQDLAEALEEELVLLTDASFFQAGFLQRKLATDNTNYQFFHDRVQQAAYNLIDEEIKQQVHLRIAQLLRNSFSEAELKERIFDLAGQYNAGLEVVDALEERLFVAQLNLDAGKKAKLSAAYQPAFKYFENGIKVLPADSWQNQYELTLHLYSEGAEAAYLSSNLEEMEKLIEVVFQKSQEDLHKIKAYNIQQQAYVSMAQNEKAMNTGLDALKMLGVNFPKNPGKFQVISALLRTKFRLRGKSIEHLLHLPRMTDDRQSAIMEILAYSMSPAYFSNPNLFALFVFKLIELSIKHGNHVQTAFAYTTYAVILCGSTNEFDEGQKYGDLALELMKRLDAKEMESKIHCMRTNFIRHWKEPYKDTHEEVIHAFHKGFDIGDFLFGAYSAFDHSHTSVYMGKNLPAVKKLMDNYMTPLIKTKQHIVCNWINFYRQMVANLMDPTSLKGELVGEHLDEYVVKPQLEQGKDLSGLCLFYLKKSMLNYLLGFNTAALQNANESVKLSANLAGTVHPPIIAFYYALSLLKEASTMTDSGKRSKWIRTARKQLKKFKIWAKSCPANQLHRQLLVQAELYKLAGKKDLAVNTYLEAIKTAHRNEAIHIEAITSELLGDFYLKQGQTLQAKKYLLAARQNFLSWGALAKVNQMDDYYELLDPSTEAKGAAGHPEDSSILNQPARQRSRAIDMSSLTKASLAIAGEIYLDKLMSKLLGVVIENAGAEQGFLIIKRGEEWVVEAKSQVGSSIGTQNVVPKAVIQYVARTKEHLVLEDVQEDSRFSTDALVKERQIRSVSCMPIINQGRSIGILYLENNLQTGVFTEKRIQFLSLLSGQIAVSLENALLYQNLEQKVEERTLEIQAEKEKSDQLLLNILPSETANELKAEGVAQPRSFENVTVMFTDFVNFSGLTKDLSAKELVSTINHYYSFFDSLMEKYGLEKIKTIGDSYMCVGGLPVENETHAIDIVKAAHEIQNFVKTQQEQNSIPATFDCRIGIHSGPVIAGIVGTKKFAYDVWGDTVNIAARLEANSEGGKLNVSNSTYQLIKADFPCTYRGKIPIKNRGEIDMYFVD